MPSAVHLAQLNSAGLQPAQTASAPSPKLVAAAHEFEAQMMKELLKPLSSTGLAGEDGDEGGDSGSGGALAAYATEAFGKALSNGGGFGVAKSIITSLSRSHSEVTATEHGDTRLKPLR
jgi:Rod binding domain-containing protein